jgi:Tfp pilus assembly protein PilO
MRSLEAQISWFARLQISLAAAIVVASALFYFVWYRPTTRDMHALRVRIEQNHRNLEASRTKAGELPTVTRAVNDLRQGLARFDRLIPRRQDLPQFLDALESLKRQAGITNCSLKPDQPRTFATHSEQTIRVDFEGDFHQVADYLAKVEDMDRMTRVRRLNFKAADSAQGTVAVQMDVSIFFLES